MVVSIGWGGGGEKSCEGQCGVVGRGVSGAETTGAVRGICLHGSLGEGFYPGGYRPVEGFGKGRWGVGRKV